jgi:hypothetical protein
MGAAVIGGVAGWALWDAVALMIGAVAGYVLVAGAVWSMLLVDHRRLLWDNERATHQDLDGDGTVGRVQEVRLSISHYDESGRFVRMEYLNIPGITQEQLQSFAREVTRGMPLAVASWTGRGALFSRGQYDALMAELQRAGLVRDDGGNIGRVLTAAGRSILKKIAEG